MDTYKNAQIAIENTYKKKALKGTLKGIFVTIICMGFDVYVLYQMFLSGNLTENAAWGNAFLGAFMLDALPFLFGVCLAHILDKAEEKNIKRRYKVGASISGLFMLLIMTVYISIRILIFLGGGDFNVGIQMFLGSMEWGSSNDNINAPDAFSTIIPIITSVFSLIVGLHFYVSMESYYQQLFEETEKQIANNDAEIKKLENALKTELTDAWTKLMPNQRLPDINEYDQIMVQLKSSLKKRQSKLYRDIYEKNVKIIYIEAQNTVNRASSIISEYTALPDQVKAFQYDEKEKRALDKLKEADADVILEIQKGVEEIWGK